MSSVTSDYLMMILEKGLISIFMLFVGASVVLFVIDSQKAKKEGRKIKLGIKIMFIIAVSLVGLSVIAVMLFIVLVILGISVYALAPR